MSISGVATNVLAKIKPLPTEERRVHAFVKDLIRVAKTVSGLDTALVGSIGKGTWLRGDHDIDLFLLFPKEVLREDLEKRGMAYGKRIAKALRGKTRIKYAEHPYVQVHASGYKIDVVPCYRIARGDEIISAVDRSPLHLEHVLEHIGGKEDETRLLKQFCKGLRIYGSDTKTEGFSGYICELLVISYGSFESVIQAAAQWRAPQRIEIVRSDSQFRDQPLIIIDPIDAKRNAAAVVSAENFTRFASGCADFLKKPSEKFFFPPAARPLGASQFSSLRKRQTKFIALRIRRPDVIDDTLYPQMRRALRRVEALLEAEEFRVLHAFAYANGYVLLMLELEVWHLPAAKKMAGPPVYAHKHVEEFLAKYRRMHCYTEGDRVAADVRRENTQAAGMLRKFFRRNAKQLQEAGIPSYIAKAARSAKLIEDDAFFRLVKKDKKLSAFMADKYFGKVF